MVSSYSYIANTGYVWGGLALPMAGGSKAIGVQVGTFGFSDQPVYTVDNPTGDGTSYSVTQTFAVVTLAQNFSDRFSSRPTTQIFSDKQWETSASALSGDFGTSFHAPAGSRPTPATFLS